MSAPSPYILWTLSRTVFRFWHGVDLVWQSFSSDPSSDTYQVLFQTEPLKKKRTFHVDKRSSGSNSVVIMIARTIESVMYHIKIIHSVSIQCHGSLIPPWLSLMLSSRQHCTLLFVFVVI